MKPHSLTIVRALPTVRQLPCIDRNQDTYLTRHLKIQILFDLPFVQSVCTSQSPLDVVGINKIFHNGSRFPKSDVVIGVYDRWYSAIGVDLDEPIHFRVIDNDLYEISILNLRLLGKKEVLWYKVWQVPLEEW